MTLVWKLLRRHVSVPQLAGFAFANLFGMLIVLLGYQLYRDVLPVFTSQDSFMKSGYVIINKKVGAAGSLSGRGGTFTQAEIDDLAARRFTGRVAAFTSTGYRVDARMGIDGQPILSSELFLESVPDSFVDVPLDDWKYSPGSKEVPVIFVNRREGVSKMSGGIFGEAFFGVMRLRWDGWTRKYPKIN